MKGVEKFNARLGANIQESIGADRVASGGPLPTPDAGHGGPSRHEGVTRPRDAMAIEVGRIRPDPDQPRKEFDEEGLAMLAESLKARGQLQPIRVRWDDGHADAPPGWVIVSGERRWRAARLAGLATIAAVEARGTPTEGEIREDQLVENCVRADLKPVEQARAFRELMDLRGYSGRALADALHLHYSGVQRALALLELPEAVRAQVDRGELPTSTALEIAKAGDPTTQVELARAAVEEGLKRSDVTEFVRAVKARRPAPAARPEPVAIDAGDGCTVRVAWRRAGGPTLVQALRRALKDAQRRAGEDAGDGRAA